MPHGRTLVRWLRGILTSDVSGFYEMCRWLCAGICGSVSLTFKGTVKGKRFVFIKLMLTLNSLNVSASCVVEGWGWVGGGGSQSNQRLNLQSWRRDRQKKCGLTFERFKSIPNCYFSFSLLKDQKKLNFVHPSALWCWRQTRLPAFHVTLCCDVPQLPARITVRSSFSSNSSPICLCRGALVLRRQRRNSDCTPECRHP